ncbi:MAG: Rpn family recombination-promoting nuclease/putative transposase [Tannerella sp.]|jgi:predicted transposase/invertase (TIGR01784 family)|nr:Rpn family recombination-promoting nuclease/putative transposase [Tannerella sp.]
MARYLDPKNDLTFKRIFGEHPELLIKFLNAVMPFEPGRHIETVTYLPSEMLPDSPTRKYSIVDVRCIDNADRQFIVEMQMYWDGAFTNRLVFNAGKAYVRQLERGENYQLLQPVYTLAILNENFDLKTDRFYHHYRIVNRENTDEVIPGLEFVLVELTDKFRPETATDRKLAVLWLRFLKEVGENMLELPPEMQADAYISRAAGLCEEGAFTPEELAAYDRYWDIIRTEKTLYYGALMKGEAIGLEKGEAIGLEKGEAIGLEKGEAIGLEKGEAIVFEKVVINSKEAGYSLNEIASISGLSTEQIIEILKRHQLM